MKRLAAIGVLLIALAVPAKATEWLNCSDGDRASFNVLLGNMNVIAVDTVEIEAGGKNWSTRGGDATLITKGQAFETADQIYIDMTDDKVDSIVAHQRGLSPVDYLFPDEVGATAFASPYANEAACQPVVPCVKDG